MLVQDLSVLVHLKSSEQERQPTCFHTRKASHYKRPQRALQSLTFAQRWVTVDSSQVAVRNEVVLLHVLFALLFWKALIAVLFDAVMWDIRLSVTHEGSVRVDELTLSVDALHVRLDVFQRRLIERMRKDTFSCFHAWFNAQTVRPVGKVERVVSVRLFKDPNPTARGGFSLEAQVAATTYTGSDVIREELSVDRHIFIEGIERREWGNDDRCWEQRIRREALFGRSRRGRFSERTVTYRLLLKGIVFVETVFLVHRRKKLDDVVGRGRLWIGKDSESLRMDVGEKGTVCCGLVLIPWAFFHWHIPQHLRTRSGETVHLCLVCACRVLEEPKLTGTDGAFTSENGQRNVHLQNRKGKKLVSVGYSSWRVESWYLNS